MMAAAGEVMGTTDAARVLPGRLLLHPVALCALALIVFNDVVLKPHWPGLVSGKLSDVGICVVLPLFLVACIEWMTWLARRACRCVWQPLGTAWYVVSVLVAAAYFAALQLSTTWIDVHLAWVAPFVGSGRVTPDITDLCCLPLCAACLRLR
jgi:hypothetical protein